MAKRETRLSSILRNIHAFYARGHEKTKSNENIFHINIEWPAALSLISSCSEPDLGSV